MKKVFAVALISKTIQSKYVLAENENQAEEVAHKTDWYDKEEVLDTELEVSVPEDIRAGDHIDITTEEYVRYNPKGHTLATKNDVTVIEEAGSKLSESATQLLEALRFCRSVIQSQGLFDLSERMAFDKATAAIEEATGEKIS
jgi:hypothetical protein